MGKRAHANGSVFVGALLATLERLLGRMDDHEIADWWARIVPDLKNDPGLFRLGTPPRAGWYLVDAPHLKDSPKLRAFGKDHQWWTDLGRGDGKDGWMSSPSGEYAWLGPVADIDAPKPKI